MKIENTDPNPTQKKQKMKNPQQKRQNLPIPTHPISPHPTNPPISNLRSPLRPHNHGSPLRRLPNSIRPANIAPHEHPVVPAILRVLHNSHNLIRNPPLQQPRAVNRADEQHLRDVERERIVRVAHDAHARVRALHRVHRQVEEVGGQQGQEHVGGGPEERGEPEGGREEDEEVGEAQGVGWDVQEGERGGVEGVFQRDEGAEEAPGFEEAEEQVHGGERGAGFAQRGDRFGDAGEGVEVGEVGVGFGESVLDFVDDDCGRRRERGAAALHDACCGRAGAGHGRCG